MIESFLMTALLVIYPATLVATFLQNKLWSVLLLISAGILYYLNNISVYGLLIFAITALAAYHFAQFSPRWQRGIKLVVFILVVLLGFHLIPGFSYIVLCENVSLSNTSPTFNIGISIDKALGAVLLVGIFTARADFKFPDLKRIILYVFAITLAVLLFTIPVGYLAVDIKLNWSMMYWAYTNLFITCIAEEVFFRGVIQQQLSKRLKDFTNHAQPLAIGTTAVIFGMAHFAGGVNYIIIAFIAGLGYGIIYARTNNLLNSILVHFLSNVIHIVFFSYPYFSSKL